MKKLKVLSDFKNSSLVHGLGESSGHSIMGGYGGGTHTAIITNCNNSTNTTSNEDYEEDSENCQPA